MSDKKAPETLAGGNEGRSNTNTRRGRTERLRGQQRRLALALLAESPSREQSDRIARASNSPNVVFQLRNKGVVIRTEKVTFTTCDGTPSWYGRYHLAPESRQLLRELLGA